MRSELLPRQRCLSRCARHGLLPVLPSLLVFLSVACNNPKPEPSAPVPPPGSTAAKTPGAPSSPETPQTSRHDPPIPPGASYLNLEPGVWVEMELRSGDQFKAILLTRDLNVKTSYATIALPLNVFYSVQFGQQNNGNDKVLLWGPTSASAGGGSASGDANEVRGFFSPDRFRIRLVTGQELEFTRDQVHSFHIIGIKQRPRSY
jgi:hypothetical protein